MDWVFDLSQKLTYGNPEYQKQKFGKVLTEDEIDELLAKEGFTKNYQFTESQKDDIIDIEEDNSLNELLDDEYEDADSLDDSNFEDLVNTDEDIENVNIEIESVEEKTIEEVSKPIFSIKKPPVEIKPKFKINK